MKRILLAVLIICAVGLLLLWREPPTLLEQAKQLHEVEPYDLPGLSLSSWIRDGLVLEARYRREPSPAGFTMMLWPTEKDARKWFIETVKDLASPEHLDTLNAEERLDYCVEVGDATTCIGIDGNRTFESEAAGIDDQAQLDANFLMRTARKHWYRVIGGTREDPAAG